MAVINGSYGEREKWVGEFSLQHSTAMFRAKGGGGSYNKKEEEKKGKKCNTQRKLGYLKVAGKTGP